MTAGMIRLRIVAVNDIYELANLPKLKTFLSKLTDLTPSAVVLAGDFLSPGELSAVDGGRGMVQALQHSGITHACLGNHEADLIMPTLEQRIRELSSSNIQVINSNLRPTHVLDPSHWLLSVCPSHSVIASRCGNVNVGLLGLLSDEASLYIGGNFHNLPLQNVLESYSQMSDELLRPSDPTTSPPVDYIIAMTHQTIDRDRDLARHILQNHPGAGHHVLIGGHEHDPCEEDLMSKSSVNHGIQQEDSVRICKSGQDAEFASIIDLCFEQHPDTDVHGNNRLATVCTSLSTELIDLQVMDDAPVVRNLVDQKMKGLERMAREILVDETTCALKKRTVLSSANAASRQCTFGSFACDAIQIEMRVDAAILPGSLIQGNCDYPDNEMTYQQIREEFPDEVRMIPVRMSRKELKQIVVASRSNAESDCFLHADSNSEEYFTHNDGDDELIQVAVHMPWLNEDGPVKELASIGNRLKENNSFPGPDDWIPGLYLVIRYCCHQRWSAIMENFEFDDLDNNNDGVLDRDEIKCLMTEVLGHEPEEYALDDMIRHIDEDENGFIEREEFEKLMSQIKS